MSQTLSVSDSVFAVAEMVKSGKLREAKRTTAQLLDNVHPSVLALLRECADILSRPTPVARPKLTALWQRSDQTGRKIIEACAPARDEWDHRQVSELPTDHTRPSTPRPRPVTTSRGTPASRAELRARRDQRQARKDTAAYFAQRTEGDDQPRDDDRPDGYALDYDHAAVPALRGTPCVCCWLERSTADQATSRRSDDGLCFECREKGRPGIPELPAGHSRADAITARCALIAAKYHPDTARAILRNEWHRTQTAQDRVTIAAWVQANTATVDAPAASAPAPVIPTCSTGGATRQVRDGHCVDCRTLDTEPAAVSGSAIDTDADAAGQAHAAALTAA
jgi:hypothetical protein